MSNVRFDIEVGKQVLLMPIGNAARRWDGKLIPGEITRIGRKYFYVKVNGISWKEEQFDRQTFECHNSDCNSGYVLYKDISENMGPWKSRCPESILSLLPPTKNEYAIAWRDRCHKYNHDKKMK